MSNIKTRLLLAVFVIMPLSSYAAGDIAAGKLKSATCAACHGAEGISITDIWPNLAGQKAGYLIKSLKDYRDGGRKDPVMSPLASPLSDDDIADLAAYYNSL
jgi:cytochrome c553